MRSLSLPADEPSPPPHQRHRPRLASTRRLGRGAVGGAAERLASALEPPTAPLLDVTAAPGASRCAPDPRSLSHPSDPPCAAHPPAVRRLERLSPNRDV
ncbi:hypothetical protein EMIHUDRAFT_373206 [Emiliania huxleyi CCMP1516]|uniref:Uncharacterized protein n=2 Tax=Emiliania huxleyi TaxID=2903 RepID=A0A0D3IS91_EMIH1|nr:hypothetical protein EMIHUDRAFT_372149 [Emiliania huxleyi CCMP1516]XP_005766555.1 hypothetical protein EMIHUDRAFT_356765 [Emiliania huxleyi CCMP1516]XP_005780220.1 hypothetical protein EMIHUDRAFT_353602 [Emiliania huxleyi CCMP1516]XP_005789517.1 hypothetical protein EMIHUDRAFT_373206 [Emiliania huxleyi CCMP1516]EOD07409.1 hypothetical protein EMIHUDRAFT_372149 [Emiliania huxleyi CCMP1516]EOD14126.1 hypothetical protein EMIHUDRAFT_356765 [Emiliania huxleyi CCMP1516]EOD27791.1 hypothetical p|eukprot:XP_005759838.1 hypothetical protein EMIHUDRAFT_372149 [Emiliania huxleyi CCMP1516]